MLYYYYYFVIAHLNGKIIEKDFAELIMDVNGVGYFVHITLYTYLKLPQDSNKAMIYIFHHNWQDGQELYGFLDKEEREVFKIMITVNGVGPKLANRILQNIEYKIFIKMISEGNVKGLTKINGLGKKTAEKLVFELQDKFKKAFSTETSNIDDTIPMDLMDNAVAAMISLGYKEKETVKIIQSILKDKKDISIEELIKESLLRIYGN